MRQRSSQHVTRSIQAKDATAAVGENLSAAGKTLSAAGEKEPPAPKGMAETISDTVTGAYDAAKDMVRLRLLFFIVFSQSTTRQHSP